MRMMTSAAALVAMTLACTAHAAPAERARHATGADGAKAAVDAAGRLRQPTQAELRALSRATPRATARSGKPMPATRALAERSVRKLRNGSVMADVSEDMLSNVTAVVRADGTVVISHEGEAAHAGGGDHE
jgi:hypothetical protein